MALNQGTWFTISFTYSHSFSSSLSFLARPFSLSLSFYFSLSSPQPLSSISPRSSFPPHLVYLFLLSLYLHDSLCVLDFPTSLSHITHLLSSSFPQYLFFPPRFRISTSLLFSDLLSLQLFSNILELFYCTLFLLSFPLSTDLIFRFSSLFLLLFFPSLSTVFDPLCAESILPIKFFSLFHLSSVSLFFPFFYAFY